LKDTPFEWPRYVGPARLTDYADYYAIADAADKSGPNERSRELWSSFAQKYPASPLREDAEFNILTILINEVRHLNRGTAEFSESAQNCIDNAESFAARHESVLTDDALLYSMKLRTQTGDLDGAWSAYSRLMAMGGVSDSTLKARYLIVDCDAMPYGTDADGKVLDSFMLRAARASQSVATGELIDDDRSLRVLALALSVDPSELRIQPAEQAARALLGKCISW
jgi:hypothetical protein